VFKVHNSLLRIQTHKQHAVAVLPSQLKTTYF
jgi:hypothetical protein